MWAKYIFVIVFFYILAVLQNSFFANFSLFGAVPDLVFILFFLLVFFERPNRYYQIIFYAITAGLFLDIFSYTYFGISIILLLIIGFIVKKVQALLQEKKNNEFPFVYFLPLFIASLIVYDSLSEHILLNFTPGFLAELVYSLFISCIAFYICKRFLKLGIDDRQLKLFNNL